MAFIVKEVHSTSIRMRSFMQLRLRGPGEVEKQISCEKDKAVCLSDAQGDICSTHAQCLDVDAKFAYTGLNFLQIAMADSRGSPHSQEFSRQLYLDALVYLHKGLPRDMEQRELDKLRESLPANDNMDLQLLDKKTSSNRSLLHRALAAIVLMICFVIRLIIPYLRSIVTASYQYERSHQICETLLTSGMTTVDYLGKQAIRLAKYVLRHELSMRCIVYCVDGIQGGLTEGFGKGLRVIETAP